MTACRILERRGPAILGRAAGRCIHHGHLTSLLISTGGTRRLPAGAILDVGRVGRAVSRSGGTDDRSVPPVSGATLVGAVVPPCPWWWRMPPSGGGGSSEGSFPKASAV